MAPTRSALAPSSLGRRVVVRRRRPDGHVGDLLGDLVAWRGGVLTIRTKEGDVEIGEADVLAGKPVPEQRLEHAIDASVGQLHRISTLSWRPLEQQWLGGWLLRAGAGFTGRANSVVPLGEPDRPTPEALRFVEQWYADRDLAPRFQLPLPTTGALDALLDAAGWPVGNGADVMVADIRPVIAALESGPEHRQLPAVRIEPAPSADWLAAYHYRGAPVPPSGEAVLLNHDHVGFASVADDTGVVAVARGAVDGGWLGVAAVEVVPTARRRGLGRHVMRGLLQWAVAEGARHVHLQVDVHNSAAQVMYAGMGFTTHHRYHYRAPA